MKYELTYADMTELFLERVRTSKLINGESAQASWLYEFDEDKLEETERLNVILPLIKWQIGINDITEEMKGELDCYYEDYTEGKLDSILNEDEKDQVIHDLIECYNKIFVK